MDNRKLFRSEFRLLSGEHVDLESNVLKLNNTLLKSLPPVTIDLKGVTMVDLSHNTIGEIHCDFGIFPDVEEMNLSSNIIETIPPSIWKMKKLRDLSLSGNRIRTIPPEMGQLLELKNLTLGENQI